MVSLAQLNSNGKLLLMKVGCKGITTLIVWVETSTFRTNHCLLHAHIVFHSRMLKSLTNIFKAPVVYAKISSHMMDNQIQHAFVLTKRLAILDLLQLRQVHRNAA